jgi:L-idonate 5-dehydrogenase
MSLRRSHLGQKRRDLRRVTPSACANADGHSAGEAAMAEPFSVVLHAAKQAGDLMGKRVRVTGCGPIGLLVVLFARGLCV